MAQARSPRRMTYAAQHREGRALAPCVPQTPPVRQDGRGKAFIAFRSA